MTSAMASPESVIDPRTDSSASRLCGGTRSGRDRRTSSAVRDMHLPSSPSQPTEGPLWRTTRVSGGNHGGERWEGPPTCGNAEYWSRRLSDRVSRTHVRQCIVPHRHPPPVDGGVSGERRQANGGRSAQPVSPGRSGRNVTPYSKPPLRHNVVWVARRRTGMRVWRSFPRTTPQSRSGNPETGCRYVASPEPNGQVW